MGVRCGGAANKHESHGADDHHDSHGHGGHAAETFDHSQ